MLTALSGGILAAGYVNFLDQDSAIRFGSMVFLSTFGIYNLQRIVKSTNTRYKSEQLEWINNNKIVLTILSIAALIGSVMIFRGIANPQSVILLLISGMISIWYVFPIFKRRLRSIPFFKSVFVSLTWTIVVIALPMIGQFPVNQILLQFLPFLFFFLGLAIPFDIRDLKYDSDQLQTIPQLVGVVGARIIAISAILIFYILFAYFNSFMRYYLSFSMVICGIIIIIAKVEIEKNEPYLSLLDSSMALLGLVLFMA